VSDDPKRGANRVAIVLTIVIVGGGTIALIAWAVSKVM
jgi:hypothetical protein